MRSTFYLNQVENQRAITPKEDEVFLFELQQALLLALKELGVLNDMQYRFAETKLQKQCGKGT